MDVPPPRGVTVEQTFDRLRITLPATTRTRLAPQRARLRRLMGVRFVFTPTLAVIYAAFVVFALASPKLSGMSIPMWLGFLVIMALILFTEEGSPQDVTQQQAVAAATVELSAHRLVIDARGEAMDLALDQIEKVTVDAAGARLRVGGVSRYLLPSRPAAERAWLGALLKDAVQQRAQRSQGAEAERRQLQAMLSQKQP